MKKKLNSAQKKIVNSKIIFESLSNKELTLKGGFSQSFSGSEDSLNDGTSNNCLGGNCAVNCDSGQNNSCNTAVGCGKFF